MFDQLHFFGVQIEARTAIGRMALDAQGHYRSWRGLFVEILQMLFGGSMAAFALNIDQFHLLLFHVKAAGFFKLRSVARKAFGIELLCFPDQRVVGVGMVCGFPLLDRFCVTGFTRG